MCSINGSFRSNAALSPWRKTKKVWIGRQSGGYLQDGKGTRGLNRNGNPRIQ
jgi:hypothetical protein